MKNLVLSFLFISAASVLFSSCQKCSTCDYSFRLNGRDSTIIYPEFCGKKTDIKEFESTVRAEAARNGGTVNCTQN